MNQGWEVELINVKKLIDAKWNIENWHAYLIAAAWLQLKIRFFMSLLKTIEWKLAPPKENPIQHEKIFSILIRDFFLGWHPSDKARLVSDLWFTSILGWLELCSFPILMKVGAWEVIGAWIGFKTIAQWKHWIDNRLAFNRYLIGNALVVILSLIVMVSYLPQLK